MAYIQWNDHFSVGVAEIDAQHKNLFVMFNSFYDGIKNKKTEAINDLLDEIIKYTIYKKEHSEFIEKAQDIKKRLDAGSLVLSLEVTNLLNEWIMNHVLDTDAKYSECLKANGIR